MAKVKAGRLRPSQTPAEALFKARALGAIAGDERISPSLRLDAWLKCRAAQLEIQQFGFRRLLG